MALLPLARRSPSRERRVEEVRPSYFRRLSRAALALDGEEGSGFGLGGELDRAFHHPGEAGCLAAQDPPLMGVGHRVAGEREGVGRRIDADIEPAGALAAIGLGAMAEPRMHQADAAGWADGRHLLRLEHGRRRRLDGAGKAVTLEQRIDRPAVGAGHHHERAIVGRHLVDEDQRGDDGVVGMGIGGVDDSRPRYCCRAASD